MTVGLLLNFSEHDSLYLEEKVISCASWGCGN